MIRTCLFDMGNVIVRFSHERMCEQIAALCGRTRDEIRSVLFDGGLEADFEAGRVSEREFHRRFEVAVGQTVDFAELRRAGSDIFEPNPPLPEILAGLKSRGVRLVLLSNTSVAHFDWIRERFDVLTPFEDFVLSYEVGTLKPDAAIYEAALQKIDCDPADCFYTDDVAENIEAAKPFGLQAERFVDGATLVNQLAARGVDVP